MLLFGLFFGAGDTPMHRESRAILNVFESKNCGAGDFIHFTDFGEAIEWEGGFIKDKSTREGLPYLIENEYIVEYNAGLGLTEKGYKCLRESVITLDPDIAEVFTSSEAVNNVLRALIQTMPQHKA
jgi:hypothetical protein